MKPKASYLKYLLATLALGLGPSAQAQLLNESFDDASGFSITDGNDAAATFFSDGTGDYFGIFDGDGDGGADFGSETSNPSGAESYTGFDDNYLVNEDMDGDGPLLPYTLTWSGISLNGETTLQISADFASTRSDANDYIVLSYRVDGGAWQDVLGVAGEEGVFNGTVYEITDFSSGFGDPSATALSADFTSVVNTFSLSGTESTLDIKAEFFNDNGDDNFAMDNLVVQETAADTTPPAIDTATGTTPADGATGVARNIVLSIPFDEPVQAGTGDIELRRTDDDSLVQAFDVTTDAGFSGNTVTLTPSAFLEASTGYYVLIGSGAVTDAAGNATTELASSGDLDFTTGSEVFLSTEAIGTRNIEADGPVEDDAFYAQNAGGEFDEYGLAEFSLSAADFDGLSIADISDLQLNLTVNDRFFSASGDYFILFTPDSRADLSGSSDYDALAFDSGSTYGINGADFATAPVAVTSAQTYPFDGEDGGGTVETVTIDLSAIKSDLIDAINSGDSFHFLIGVPSTGGAVATFSGFGNTFDPGAPELRITATPGSPVAALIIDESGGTTRVEEGGDTDTFDVALNSTPASDVDVALTPDGELDLGNGAGNALTLTFTPANATTPQTVTVTAVDDADEESLHTGEIAVATSTADPDYQGITDSITATIADNDVVASVLITQYYEGSFGNNKYIELTNVSDSPVDLTGYTLARWGNARAEEYKTATSISADEFDSLDLSPLGTLAAGQTVLLANDQSTTPIDAGDTDLAQGFPGPLTFNGNDSVVIYSGSTPNPDTIVDAIGFTDSGDEGANTSFVRVSTNPGYDLNPGSNATSPQFASVWQQVDLAIANAASLGDDAFLGSSDLVTPPPQVFFTESSITVNEGDGSFDLTVEIRNPDGSPVSVDIVFDAGDGLAELADIDNYTTQTVNFGAGAADGDQQTVTVNLTDDGEEEPSESAVFELQNLVTSGDAITGSPSTATVTIQDNDTVIPNVFISEVVDPADNFQDGRYVELYNPTGSAINLAAGNWNLIIYVNANTSGTDIPLTGTIPAGGTYIVSESEAFDAVYGVADEDDTGNINSNGDDSFELRFSGGQETGVLVDVYGSPGTQGTDEPWNFEDSRAVRNADVTTGNPTWTASEWTIEAADVADATPRLHPESDLAQPSGVSATAIDESEIEIAFSPEGGNDVVIVFNQTGAFTTPSGTPPAVGESFAGGTLLFQGQSSPFAHTGLDPETEYFYALYSFDGVNYSNPVAVDATTPAAGVIDSEDFSDPDWFNATIQGDDPWDFSEADAFIDGATNDGTGTDEHYLVSPALDLSSETGVTLAFDYAGGFDAEGVETLELLYSTDYADTGDPDADAAAATWNTIAFSFDNILSEGVTADDLVTAGPVALPGAVEGETSVRLAFLYTADGTLEGSEQWILDNFVVQGSGGDAPDPLGDYLTDRSLSVDDLDTDTNGNGFTVLEEYLAGFGDGTGPEVIAFGVDPDASALTLTSDRATEPDGITVELLATGDLTAGFSPVAFTTDSVDNGDGTHTRTYTETSPPAEADHRFYQLRITAD